MRVYQKEVRAKDQVRVYQKRYELTWVRVDHWSEKSPTKLIKRHIFISESVRTQLQRKSRSIPFLFSMKPKWYSRQYESESCDRRSSVFSFCCARNREIHMVLDWQLNLISVKRGIGLQKVTKNVTSFFIGRKKPCRFAPSVFLKTVCIKPGTERPVESIGHCVRLYQQFGTFRPLGTAIFGQMLLFSANVRGPTPIRITDGVAPCSNWLGETLSQEIFPVFLTNGWLISIYFRWKKRWYFSYLSSKT